MNLPELGWAGAKRAGATMLAVVCLFFAGGWLGYSAWQGGLPWRLGGFALVAVWFFYLVRCVRRARHAT